MKRWLRAFLVYLPGIALLVAGIAVSLAMPTTTASASCPCTTGPNGTVCPPCPPPAPTINPLGPLLLLAAGIYALAVYLIRRGSRPTPSSAGPTSENS